MHPDATSTGQYHKHLILTHNRTPLSCPPPSGNPAPVPPPSAVATISTNALFLLDTHTGLRFLIDTGICRSLLPKSKVHSGCIAGTDTNLIAANGSRMLTYSYKTLQLSFAGSKYKWDFIVADISTPIIGADFLANFNLLVDMANHRLVNTSTLASTSIAAAPAD